MRHRLSNWGIDRANVDELWMIREKYGVKLS